MLNTLLFLQLMIAILLIMVILLQKTSADGLSGMNGGNGNMGLVSRKSAAGFLSITTIILGAVFFINSLILANLSSGTYQTITNKIEHGVISDKKNSVDGRQDDQNDGALPVK